MRVKRVASRAASATTARRSARRSRRSKRTSRWPRTCRRTCWRSDAGPPKSSDDLRFLLRADDTALRLLPRDARPRRLPPRVADRRLGDHPGAAARPDGRDRADVGDADRRRRVRLRQGPARRRPGAPSSARIGVRLRAPGDPLPAEGHARPAAAAVRRRRGARGRRAS